MRCLVNFRAICGLLLLTGSALSLIRAFSAQSPRSTVDHAVMRKGNRQSDIQVEIFLDLSCPDTAAAWPTMSKAVEEWDDSVEFIYRLFPLPYHHGAFTIAQATQLVCVYAQEDETTLEAFMNRVLEGREEIDSLSLGEPYETSLLTVRDMLSEWAAEVGVTTAETFRRGMSDPYVADRAKLEFQNGCRRGVNRTPTVFINGVKSVLLSGRPSDTTWHQVLANELNLRVDRDSDTSALYSSPENSKDDSDSSTSTRSSSEGRWEWYTGVDHGVHLFTSTNQDYFEQDFVDADIGEEVRRWKKQS